MLQKLIQLIKTHKSVVIYIFFGVLTTLVNYAVYFPLYNITSLSATLSNVIAWCVSVVFAFLTNKPFVFNSCDWSIRVTVPEFLKFTGCRVASGLLESVIVLLTVDVMNMNGNLWKLITGVLVIVLNYIGSKFFVFNNNK